MSRKKKPKRQNDHYIGGLRCNYHHFWFQKKHYQQGYAKTLREFWYCGAYIPIQLHAELHSVIHDTPTPPSSLCREAYEELCRREQLGFISQEDPPWERLTVLIEFFEDKCPATTAILEWQKQKILKFYRTNLYNTKPLK